MNICEKPNYIIKKTPTSKWEFYTYKKYILENKPDGAIIMDIPCGQCKSCLKNKSLEMFNRNLMEHETSKSSYFLTLTYNNEELTKQQHTIKELREFIHNLQDYYWNNFKLNSIRYFGVSEYGDKSNRYHFHILIYNIPIKISDFKLYCCELPKKQLNWHNKKIDNYFTNNVIAKLWGKGHITIAPINSARIGYIVSYLFKSVNDLTKYKKKQLEQLGLEAPSKIQSDNLGKDFIYLNKDKFKKQNYVYINGQKIYANKYIDTKANILSEERTLKRLYKRLDKVGTNIQNTKINNHKGTL